jgi:hypothetical protein
MVALSDADSRMIGNCYRYRYQDEKEPRLKRTTALFFQEPGSGGIIRFEKVYEQVGDFIRA